MSVLSKSLISLWLNLRWGREEKWMANLSFFSIGKWPHIIYHSKQDTSENKKGAIDNCVGTQV